MSDFFARFNINSVRDWIDIDGRRVDDYSELGGDYLIKRCLGWHPTFGYCEAILLSNKKETFIMLTWIDFSVTDENLRNEIFEQMRHSVMSSSYKAEN